MIRFTKRLDAIEPALIATMPLPPDVEAMLQRLATKLDIDANELRQETVRLAWEHRHLTLDQQIARIAAEHGRAPADVRRDMEALGHEQH